MNSDCRELFPSLEYLGSATRYRDEIFEIVDRTPLFENLESPEIESLCGFMKCFGAPRNQVLLSEDDEGDFLLIILTGQVLVNKKVGEGAQTMATVSPGATLGEMSMVDGAPRFATCITTEPTDFAVLTRDALNEVLLNTPRLGNKLLLVVLQLMTRRLRETCINLLPNYSGTSI